MYGLRVLNELTPEAHPAEVLLWDLEKADGWDRYWRRQQFDSIPDPIAMPIAEEYRRLYGDAGEQGANRYLRQIAKRLKELAVDPAASDDDLCAMAKQLADACRRALQYAPNHTFAARRLADICAAHQILPPKGLRDYLAEDREQLATACFGSARHRRIARASVSTRTSCARDGSVSSEHQLPKGVFARLTDDAWWRRKLRSLHAQRAGPGNSDSRLGDSLAPTMAA